jgi:hypothetical protein
MCLFLDTAEGYYQFATLRCDADICLVELVEVGSRQLSWWGGARWICERALRGAGLRVSGDELWLARGKARAHD